MGVLGLFVSSLLLLSGCAAHGEVLLQDRSVLALRLHTAAAGGRQPGSYADMSPVHRASPPGISPQPGGPPAHATPPTPWAAR